MMDLQFTKICFKCGKQKEKTKFYKHSGMSDGRLNKCIECTKNDTRLNTEKLTSTPEGLEKERQRHREKYYRLEYKEKHKPTPEMQKKAMKKYREKYPEKYKARIISQRLQTKTKGYHLHHWNYNIEYANDIIELTIKDHAKIHRFIKYDKNTFMYKDLNGNLLDTKEKHLQLIYNVLNYF